jgi:hypothetical protein
LATEPFQPTLRALADLERDDPKFAFPTAPLVGLYQRLWESCVSKKAHRWPEARAEQCILQEACTHLRNEMDSLQLRHNKQLSRLRLFEQTLESSRDRLGYSMTGITLPDSILQGCQTWQEKGEGFYILDGPMSCFYNVENI